MPNETVYTPASPPPISHELRLSAIAGFLGAVCWIAGAVLFPTISDALHPTALEHGLAQLASHSAVAMACQHLFAVSDIALIVFMFGLAATAQPPGRSLACRGAFLFGISFASSTFV
jgi:hypothetical protein